MLIIHNVIGLTQTRIRIDKAHSIKFINLKSNILLIMITVLADIVVMREELIPRVERESFIDFLALRVMDNLSSRC